jgi:hypothetical protein
MHIYSWLSLLIHGIEHVGNIYMIRTHGAYGIKFKKRWKNANLNMSSKDDLVFIVLNE